MTLSHLWATVVLLYLNFSRVQYVGALGIWKNEAALVELLVDWQANASPKEHKFVEEVNEFYLNDTRNAFSNNLMGMIAFEHGDNRIASQYFRSACDFTQFVNIDYVRNYVRAQNRIDARVSVHAMATALQEDIYNSNLISELVNWLTAICKQSSDPLSESLRIVHMLPTMHPLWVVFVESALRMIDGPGVNVTDVAITTTYALTIYPRSCELLLLRAILYQTEGDHACAVELYRSADKLRRLFTNHFDATSYFTRLAALTAAHTVTGTTHCMPQLHTHQKAHYQTLYNTIVTNIGNYWTNLSLHYTVPTYHNFTAIVTHSVHTAQLDTDSMQLHLPSLQVGCSSAIQCARPGFLIADALESISTHYVCMTYDMHAIESSSIGLLYSSHTLEHLSHNNPPSTCSTYPKSSRSGEKGCYSELDATLAEFRRVLADGGTLLVSVPDIMVLAKYYMDPTLQNVGRSILRNIMYGGQVDQFDFHKNAFFFEYLVELLTTHGFCDVTRVKEFGLFMDASGSTFEGGVSFSLSVKAIACDVPVL